MSSERAILGVVGLVAVAVGVVAFVLLRDPRAADPATPPTAVERPIDGPGKPTGAPATPTGGPIAELDRSGPLVPRPFSPTFDPQAAGNLLVGGQVRTVEGLPVENAAVELVYDASPVTASAQEAEVRGALYTNAEGKFYFAPETCPECALASHERYVLRVSHPDFAVERITNVEARTGAFRDIVLTAAGLKVNGMVLDQDGRPIADAVVKVFDSQVAAADPEGALERAAKTDGTGRYEVAHLKPGLKRVWVTKPGFASAGRHNHTLENARPETRIDFTLFPGHVIAGVVLASDTGAGIPAAVVTFKPTRLGPAAAKFDPARDIPLEAEELRKRIAAAGGSPEAAKVQAGSMTREEAEIMRSRRMADEAARRAGADPAHAGDGDVKRDPSMIDDIPPAQREWQKKQQEMAVAHQNLASTTVVYRTKADGTFRADGLAEGSYQITVHAPGYAPPPIQSAETGAENVVFNMLLNGRISGHVIDDETEKPIVGGFTVGIGVGADARAAPYHLKKHFGPPKWTDGAFTYGDLRPGRYVLIAEAPGYAGGRSEETTLAQSEQRDSVVIRLIKGATVKGRVIDAQGKPVADAVVTTGSGAPAGPEQIFIGMIDSALRKDSKSARTRADGTFELANLFDGRYVLKVTHPDFGPYASDAFDVPRAGEVTRPDVTLARGGSIVGRVLTNNGPDDKAKVSVMPAAGGGFGSMREAATDGDGRYEVHGLAPGEYRVVLAQQGGTVNLGALLQLAQQKAAAAGGGAPGMPAPKTYVLAEGQRIVVDFP